jgi:ABC-2 type transport system ATP-binding protein
MIQVEHLSKRFGEIEAVSDLSFSVEKGEILGFLGPNGAGKTTTMRILTGFFPQSSGKAVVAGCDVLADPIGARSRTGYLPENVPLWTDLTVTEYLGTVGALKGMVRADLPGAIDRMIETCGLGDVRNRLIGHLSKGFRQRVGLAQAMVNDPEVLILDEPTVGLDPRQIIEIRELIKSLAGGHTVILSTHILPEVAMTCDRVVIIKGGRVLAIDTPANLDAQLAHGRRVRIVIAGADADEARGVLGGIPGVTDAQAVCLGDDRGVEVTISSEAQTDIRGAIAPLAVAKGWCLLELAPVSLSLEEIFLELVTEEAAS